MLKTGDIVLVEGTGFFAFITKLGNLWSRFLNPNRAIKFTHVGMMVSDTEIIEALGQGVTIRAFPYKRNYEVWRGNFDPLELFRAREKAVSMVGQKYSWWLLFALGTLKVLHLEWLFKGIGHKGKICSVLLGWAFADINYFFNNEGIDVLDPNDIGDHVIKSPRWEKVC
jgi:uncharacterized protein YycO